MGSKLSTTLKKIESCSKQNRELLQEFYRYRQSLDHKSDLATNNILTLLIYFDRFLDDRSFQDISKKEQIIDFLEHKFVSKHGNWVKREHDLEGKWITTWNQYLIWLKTFFRWLGNRDVQEDESNWETPTFLQKIKSKKPLRDSPYEDSEVWELDEILTIVKYVDTRDQAIITLLWDLDARNHEITALRIKDIVLNEQYGEGNIPSNTKTGGGPILLRCSFPYVRDWLNKHPFKTEPKAKLICSLRNGGPINPDAVQRVMKRLRLKIKRIVSMGSGLASEEKEKLQLLLRTKKWNPYCIRHSAIDADAAYLPEHALKKKVRWSMNSKQAVRYVKRKMNDELTFKILEHDGIKLPQINPPSSSNIICVKCNYVNKLESKYCERTGCAYPLSQQAFEEIKKQEESRLTDIVNERLESKDQEINELKEQMAKMSGLVEKLHGYVELYKPAFDSVMKQANPHLDGKFIDIDMSILKENWPSREKKLAGPSYNK